jgi:hypothetical protein
VLHFDHYLSLLLFFFFNPILTSLRGLQSATKFPKLRRALGIPRVGLSALSEASTVFPAQRVEEIVRALAGQIEPSMTDKRLYQLTRQLTVVDGTLLKAAPRVAWAVWIDENNRAAKLHLQFEVLNGGVARAEVTDANAGEVATLRASLESGRLYVLDRGYIDFGLYQEISSHQSSFVGRIHQDNYFEITRERELTDADRQAGVISDQEGRLGRADSKWVRQHGQLEIRVVTVRCRTRNGKETVVRLATDLLDLPGEIIALIYRYRWQIELFFRWLKCTLGFRHLLAESPNGVRLQVYAALIATMLIVLWTGRKPTKRIFEAVGLWLQGWATDDELIEILGLSKNET